MSSQKATNAENIKFGEFHGPLTQICNTALAYGMSLPFFVTKLVLITGLKSMVLFIISEIILNYQEKTEETENFRPY